MSSAVSEVVARAGASSESIQRFERGGSFRRRVVSIVLSRPSALRWIAGAALLESAFALVGPWLSAKVIDRALPDGASDMLMVIVVLVLAAALHGAWAGWLRERVTIVLSTRVEVDCLDLVIGRLLQTPLQSLQDKDFGGTSETMAAASRTSSELIRTIVSVSTGVFGVVLTLGLLAFWFPGLAALVLVSAACMLALASAYAVVEGRLAAAALEASSRQQQTLHVLLRGVAALRAFGATERLLTRWRSQLHEQTQASVRQQSAHVSQTVVFEGAPLLVALAGTVWFVRDVFTQQATLGHMMMGTMLVGSAMSSFVQLAEAMVVLQALRPHFGRVNQLLEASEGSEPPSAAIQRHPSMGDLVLDAVWFRYPYQERWVLEACSRSFEANQVNELRAASGAGKTTLLRLLAGLLEPERGRVLVQGIPAKKARASITYLPQQSTVLEASIATNLRVLSGKPLEHCMYFAKLTGLDQLISSLPMGVETLVSIGGSNLSAGQRQLILLTAAFAAGRPVVLLDEATSQLDPQTQANIDWAALTRGRTVVVVRHD